jgi:hypothetical protein
VGKSGASRVFVKAAQPAPLHPTRPPDIPKVALKPVERWKGRQWQSGPTPLHPSKVSTSWCAPLEFAAVTASFRIILVGTWGSRQPGPPRGPSLPCNAEAGASADRGCLYGSQPEARATMSNRFGGTRSRRFTVRCFRKPPNLSSASSSGTRRRAAEVLAAIVLPNGQLY